MAQHNDIGKLGEDLAKDFLQKHSYTILETNWRYKKAEVDIIAKDGEVLVFIEVKSRTNLHFGKPAEFVTAKKEILMFDAANAYMEEIGHEWEIRFDIVSVAFDKKHKAMIQHDKDAFFP